MKILLTANASYDPPKGGSTRSNLAWMRYLASHGHSVRVLAPAEGAGGGRSVDGIAIRSVSNLQRHPELIADEIRATAPDWVLVSSEDVAHILLRAAAHAAPGRIVYLAHTPQFLPFGPESWHKDESASNCIRNAAGVVVISHHMAAYVRQHLGRDAAVVHPPIYGAPPYRLFGQFGPGCVLMVNPCVVKGVSIFLALADRFPNVEFAALEGWGTTARDRAALAQRSNVQLIHTVANIEDALSRATCLLVPSVWYEGFGLIAMEAMLRGLPVIASNSGGLEEAKRGTGYVVPVRSVERYEMSFDDTGMPRAIVPEQDIGPWATALQTLLTDERAYWEEAKRSRHAALRFVSGLDAADLENYLAQLKPHTSPVDIASRLAKLDPQQRARLLEQLRAKRGNG
jgi:glycosyltransferase involved in cell wall biosynthesis